MNNDEFSVEQVKSYYQNDFARHLEHYFQIEGSKSPCDYAKVLYMDRLKGVEGNPSSEFLRCDGRWLPSSSGTQNFVFSGLLLHMILAAQAINAVCGHDKLWDYEMLSDLYRATGWPMFSAGIGGPYAPVEAMLRESHLSPEPFEAVRYGRMLDVVAPFMREEIQQFLSRENSQNINRDAYERLLCNVEGRTEEIIRWMEAEENRIRDEFGIKVRGSTK